MIERVRNNVASGALVFALAMGPAAAGAAEPVPTGTAEGRPFAGLGRATSRVAGDAWHVLSSPARLNREGALWLGATFAVGGIVLAFDEDIQAGALRSRGNAVYDAIIDVGETFEPAGYVVRTAAAAAVGLAIGHVAGNPKLQDVSGQILETHLISSVIRNSAKFAVGRARPEEGLGAYDFEPGGGGNSFPSGHTATLFEVATVLSHHARSWPVSVVVYGVASSVALQRIDDGKHWASDVFLPMVSSTVIARTVIRRNQERALAVAPVVMPSGALGLGMALRF